MRWAGATTFGNGYVQFEGAAGDNAVHSHLALQVVVSREVVIELKHKHRIAGSAVYIRPNVPHRLIAGAKVRLLLMEPHSAAAKYVLDQLPSEPAGVLKNADAILDTALRESAPASIDPRLCQAMGVLSGHDALQISITELAAAQGLSSQRLRELAAREIGMTLGRWRLWTALGRAAASIAGGHSIVEAAYDAGFSDQAHLTRTMRDTLGITPNAGRGALSTS